MNFQNICKVGVMYVKRNFNIMRVLSCFFFHVIWFEKVFLVSLLHKEQEGYIFCEIVMS